jgi:hypothetical protein
MFAFVFLEHSRPFQRTLPPQKVPRRRLGVPGTAQPQVDRLLDSLLEAQAALCDCHSQPAVLVGDKAEGGFDSAI